MRIKVTYPIHNYNDRVLMPGETIDVPASKGRFFIGNGWAIEVAEETNSKRKVKRDDWQND